MVNDFKIVGKILDSNDFTVGGGSAAALAGSMASGLIAMVAKLSLRKDYGLSEKEYRMAAEEGDKLSNELLKGAEEDTKAFLQIKKAYALPKATEEEKRKRSLAIQNAGILAATVPKNNGLLCKRVLEVGLKLQNKSNPNAKSDLEEAVLLAKAGMIGCALNIEANLSLIKDEKIKISLHDDANLLKKV